MTSRTGNDIESLPPLNDAHQLLEQALDLMPDPWDSAKFWQALAARYGRAARLHSIELDSTSACGLIAANTEDLHVFVPQHADAVARLAIEAHEAGHLLAGHILAADPAQQYKLNRAALRRLLPDLPEAMLGEIAEMGLYGRTSYDDAAEQTAEAVGRGLVAEVLRRHRTRLRPARQSGAAGRIADAFNGYRRRSSH